MDKCRWPQDDSRRGLMVAYIAAPFDQAYHNPPKIGRRCHHKHLPHTVATWGFAYEPIAEDLL